VPQLVLRRTLLAGPGLGTGARLSVGLIGAPLAIARQGLPSDPGGVEEPFDGGSSHMAFDSRHGLGLRDLTNYVAHSHTPQAHCVCFGRAVTGRTRNTRYRAAR
jgi:hypothetical protein